MVRDNVQLETAVNTISHEYLLDFTSEYGIPEMLHPELPGPGDRIIDFSEGKNNRFFWVDERVFPTVVDWRTNAPKDGMPAAGTYSVEAVRALDTYRTPIQKQLEMLLCLVGLSRRYYLGDEVHPTFLYDNDQDMDLFSLIRAPNPTKVKVGSRPRAPHKVPLLTLTANRVIEMDDPATATDSLGVPPTIERYPLDFSLEAGPSNQGTAASEVPPFGDVPAAAAPEPSQVGVVAADPHAATESRKRGRDETDTNDPPKSLRRDHADPRPSGSSHEGKRLAAIQLGLASTASMLEDAPTGVSDPDPLCFADPPARPSADVAQSSPSIAAAGDPESENASSPTELRLRFEQEAKLLKKSVAQVAHRDKRIQARELEIKNLEALLETEADMKKAAEVKSAGLIKELEDMRARFSDLQVSHEHLSQQVASLKEQVSGEEKLKAAFEEFKLYEDDRAFADVVSAGIAKGMSEGLRHGVEHGQAQQNLESIEAYDPEAEAKFVATLQALKDLKYPLLDQLEGLKDAPMDVIMAALYLESDTGADAPQCIRDLRPSSSQLTIPVYPEVRDPRNAWACKEEIVLANAITANISRAEKKKKCRIVCRTHRVGSAHHTSDILYAPWESLFIPNVLGIALRTQSLRPLGLQPVYAA
nr:transposase (putative), gypsy type [Tanacetum cinerariifolium]